MCESLDTRQKFVFLSGGIEWNVRCGGPHLHKDGTKFDGYVYLAKNAPKIKNKEKSHHPNQEQNFSSYYVSNSESMREIER